MSHYAVSVFTEKNGKTLEELLAPFDENLEVPRYISKAELIASEKKRISEYESGLYADYLRNPEAYIAGCNNPNHIKYIQEEFPKQLEWTDEDCYKHALDGYDEECVQTDGSVLNTYNPNSKWDWYCVGGRFSGTIPVKRHGGILWADDADVKDVAISYRNEKAYNRALRFWQLKVEGIEPETEEDKELLRWDWYKKEYYTERYDDAEDYANSQASLSFYSALLPSGEWLEPGAMGWWGMSGATGEDMKAWRKKAKELLEEAQKRDWHITIVDCHI